MTRKIKSALVYPIFICITGAIILFLLFTKIIPMILVNIVNENINVSPDIEKMLVLSNILINNKISIVITFLLLILLCFILKGMVFKKFSKLKFHIPFISCFYKKIYEINIERSLCLLISSGVPLLNAMQIVIRTYDNDYIKKKLLESLSSIKEGMNLGKVFSEMGIFSKMSISMITLGDETGELDSILGEASEINEVGLFEIVKNISSFVEPILIIILGTIITIVVMKIILPIMESLYSFDEIVW